MSPVGTVESPPDMAPSPLPPSFPGAAASVPPSSVWTMGDRSLEQMRWPLAWGTQSRPGEQSLGCWQGPPWPWRDPGELHERASTTVVAAATAQACSPAIRLTLTPTRRSLPRIPTSVR